MFTIKVLGSGCPTCKNLESMCKEIIAENNISAEIQKVTDFKEIMSYGIMVTPGLVINDKVIHSGKLPDKSTLTQLIVNFIKEN